MILKTKKRTLWWLICSITFLSISFLSGWVLKYYRDYQNLPTDHLIGNRISNIEMLKEEGFPFSFLVIGDTHGSRMGEALIKKALRTEKFSFLIHLGDFVSEPDIWSHRFFLTEMIKEMKLPFPVFLVPGNHDIDYTSRKISNKERRVTQEVFDSLYGARNFHFIYNQCLFILCEVDPKDSIGYLNYLRGVLSEKGSGEKYIFVFIHYPPTRVGDIHEKGLPKENDFFSIMKEYKVTRCFFGHFHGYWRSEWEGINLIISGGGGRLKERQPEWGKFHHILKVRVNEHGIEENLIVLKEEMGFEDRFEHWIFTQVFPRIKNHAWIPYLTTGFFLCLGVFYLIFFIKERNNGSP